MTDYRDSSGQPRADILDCIRVGHVTGVLGAILDADRDRLPPRVYAELLEAHLRLTMVDDDLIAALERDDAEMAVRLAPLAPVISLEAKRQERDVLAKLRASLTPTGPYAGHRCGLCRELWSEHEPGEIEAHAAEILKLGQTDNPFRPGA